MATITVKNIPEDIYQDLKRLAKLRHRSINNEIIVCIEKALGKSERDHEKLRTKIREFHKKVKGQLSLDEIQKSIDEGRP
jgi:plasmid stability protein